MNSCNLQLIALTKLTLNTTGDQVGSKMDDFKKKYIPFVKILRVEPFVFLFMTAFACKSITAHQLIQDKLCLFKHGYDEIFCTNASNIDDPLLQMQKNTLLKESSKYSMYSVAIVTLPGVVWSAFVGSWSDKYMVGRKMLLIIASIGSATETLCLIFFTFSFRTGIRGRLRESADLLIRSLVAGANYTLLAFVASGLCGTLVFAFAGSLSYISRTTPLSLESIRFTIFEVSIFVGKTGHCETIMIPKISVAMPLGTALGGFILGTPHFKTDGQLHNYLGVFAVTLALQVAALLWSIFAINESNKSSSENYYVNQQNDQIDGHSNATALVALRDIFNLEHIAVTCKTFIKHRIDNRHKQIWLMVLSLCILTMGTVGQNTVMFVFVQKQYHWNAVWFSQISAIQTVITTLGILVLFPYFIKGLKMKDATMAICGVLSLFLQNVSCGSISSPIGYYFGLVAGILTQMPLVAVRSRISKIVDKDEIGKIFSLLVAMEWLTPLVGTTLFAAIFNLSIAFYPGLIFQIVCVLLFIPLGIFIWLDIKFDQQIVKVEHASLAKIHTVE